MLKRKLFVQQAFVAKKTLCCLLFLLPSFVREKRGREPASADVEDESPVMGMGAELERERRAVGSLG